MRLESVRRLPDWIESYLHFTKDIPSPEILRKWSAISTIAGAMQRRIWVESSQGVIYPNLYILLVAPPGIGKTEAIRRVGDLWRSTENLHVAPNSVTRAALVDKLSASVVKSILPSGEFQLFHGLNVAASEFGVLCPAHDLEFLNTLNDIFDCGDSFSEERRHRDEQVDIKYPILNILGGTQPSFLSEILPEQAWSMGFTSRLIMIYSASPTTVDLFSVSDPVRYAEQKTSYEQAKKLLKDDLTGITQLYGAMYFDPAMRPALIKWHSEGFPPIPNHSRLQHYNTRRIMTVFKLLMISSISRDNSLRITMDDLTRAQDWLIEAEDKMPDIFRDMAGKSDKQVIDDLYDFLWRVYARNGQQPITDAQVVTFLQGKVPSEKIQRITDLCQRTGTIIKIENGPKPLWKPGVKDNIPGVE